MRLWRGADANRHKSVPDPLYVQLRQVRAMKKLEWLPPQPDASAYSRLIDRYESFLITKVRLLEVVKAQEVDLKNAHLPGLAAINEGNPALRQSE